MHITQVSSSIRHGGAAQAVRQIHLGLVARGVDSCVVTRDLGSREDNVIHVPTPTRRLKRLRRLFSEDWEHALQYEAKPPLAFEVFSDTLSSQKSLWEFIPNETNIVQLNWTTHILDWNSFFSSPSRVPLVWRFADLNPMTGGCHYPSTCVGMKSGCRHCPQVFGQSVQRRISRNWETKKELISRIPSSDMTLIAQSEWMVRQVSESPIFNRFKTVVISNGVDRSKFFPVAKSIARSALGIETTKPVCLVFANDGYERKGSKRFLDSFALLKTPPFHLLVVGESRHSALLRPDVTVSEIIPKQLLRLFYSAANLLVFPSRQDNCPNTVLESQACGTPVLAFRNSGISELICDESNGWLIEDGDANAMVEAACEYLTRREFLEIASVASTPRDLSVMLDDYIRLYSAICDRQSQKISR